MEAKSNDGMTPLHRATRWAGKCNKKVDGFEIYRGLIDCFGRSVDILAIVLDIYPMVVSDVSLQGIMTEFFFAYFLTPFFYSVYLSISSARQTFGHHI